MKALVLHNAGQPLDDAVSEAVRRYLEGRGLQVETQNDLLPGQDIKLVTGRMVREAECVVCVVTRSFLAGAGNHWRLLRAALTQMEELPEGSRFIIPIWAEECGDSYRTSRIGHLYPFNMSSNAAHASEAQGPFAQMLANELPRYAPQQLLGS